MSIPAPDGTLANLDLDQGPLTLPFVFGQDTSVVQAIGNGQNVMLGVAQFRMPFYGDVVFQGWVRMVVYTGGIQQVDIAIDARSTPTPSLNPYATMRTEGGAGDYVTMMPMLASWTSVTPGTLVDIQLFVQNGWGGPGIQIDNQYGVAYCTKT